MKRFFNQVMERLTKSEYKREPENEFNLEAKPKFELKPLEELEKTPFSPRDYERSSDLQEELRLYQESLEKIRAKYRAHVLDTYYINGEDLLRRESEREIFCLKVNISFQELEQKINNYCRKKKIPQQELYIPKENVDTLRSQELEETIAAEAELEKIKFYAKNNNCSVELLEKGVDLAKKYRSLEEVAMLEKMLAEVKTRGSKVRDSVNNLITNTILNDIIKDANLSGERREGTEYASNWQKKLDSFQKNLAEKRIYLDERYEGSSVFMAEAKQIWKETNDQIKAENAARRSFQKQLAEVLRKHPQIGIEYYSALAMEKRELEEMETRTLEEYLHDARNFAGNTTIRTEEEKIKMVRHLLKTANERKERDTSKGPR